MSRALDGTNPLSYQGVRPRTPPDMVIPGIIGSSQPRNPTANDINYNLGDHWLNTTTQGLWYLAFLGSHLIAGRNTRYAVWLPFVTGSGFMQTLSGNAGINPVTVDGANNINVFGDTTVGLTVIGDGVHTLLVTTSGGQPIGQGLTGNAGGFVPFNLAGNINVVGDGVTVNVVGNPGTNTLTISAVGTGTVETLTGNSGGAVHPTAGNINVIGAAGLGLTVVGNPGTSTLTITSASGGAVAQSITTQDGHVILPSAAGNWNYTATSVLTTTGNAGTNTFTTNLTNGTNGQVIIGGGAAPAWANITSTGGTINITNGANTINLEVAQAVHESAFLAYNAADIANVSGDNSLYILGTAPHPLTTSYDLHGDFGGSTFTAPFTGIYYFHYEASTEKATGFAAGQSGAQGGITTTNFNYQDTLYSPVATGSQPAGSGGVQTFSFLGSVQAHMDMGDVANANLYIGTAGKDVTLSGNGAGSETYFGGCLITLL